MIQTHCDVHRSLVEMLCVLYGLNFWHMCSKHATRIADQVRKYPFHVWRYLKLKVYQHCALDLDIEHAALACSCNRENDGIMCLV